MTDDARLDLSSHSDVELVSYAYDFFVCSMHAVDHDHKYREGFDKETAELEASVGEDFRYEPWMVNGRWSTDAVRRVIADCVVYTYMRPFSGNQNEAGKKVRLSHDVAKTAFDNGGTPQWGINHDHLWGLRDQVVAHSDHGRRFPELDGQDQWVNRYKIRAPLLTPDSVEVVGKMAMTLFQVLSVELDRRLGTRSSTVGAMFNVSPEDVRLQP